MDSSCALIYCEYAGGFFRLIQDCPQMIAHWVAISASAPALGAPGTEDEDRSALPVSANLPQYSY
jgi:hypothetical protein